jgi:hypothetical protein
MSFASRLLSVGLLSLCVTLANAASKGPEGTVSLGQHSLAGDAPRIATLRLHLHDGDYRIVGVDSGDITVRTDGKNKPLAKKMKIRFDRKGDVLDLTLSHVPKNELQVTIEIPRETGLYARMRAGDLSVMGVTGDKDLELTGGDLSVQVPDPKDYGPVDLSVKFGDLSGSQFGDPKGWIGNSVKLDGSGKYRLHAHVFAGDLLLKP